MNIRYHKHFLKNYKKRISSNPKLVRKFKERLNLLLLYPKQPILNEHKLIGKLREYKAISISGDIRLIYKIKNDELLIYNIGSHNQVY